MALITRSYISVYIQQILLRGRNLYKTIQAQREHENKLSFLQGFVMFLAVQICQNAPP